MADDGRSRRRVILSRRSARLGVVTGDMPDHDRPTVRGECEAGGWSEARPCPYVGCRHNLALDVDTSGAVRAVVPTLDLEALPDTCALDVAEAHPHGLTLDEVSQRLGLTRERVRQIEDRALAKVLWRLA